MSTHIQQYQQFFWGTTTNDAFLPIILTYKTKTSTQGSRKQRIKYSTYLCLHVRYVCTHNIYENERIHINILQDMLL